MSKIKLDLHDIFNKGDQIEQALQDVINQAVQKKIDEVEIIPGKGSGQLKKRVLRFLDQKQIRQMYHRIDKDSKNFGRLFVRLNTKKQHLASGLSYLKATEGFLDARC